VHFVAWQDWIWLDNPVWQRTREKATPRRAITSFLIITLCWATLTVANTSNYSSEERLVASVGVIEDSWRVERWQLFCNCLAVTGRRYKQTLNYETPLQISSPLEHHNCHGRCHERHGNVWGSVPTLREPTTYTDLLHHDEVNVRCTVTPCRLMYKMCVWVTGCNIGRDVDCSLRGSLQTVLPTTTHHSWSPWNIRPQ